MPDVGPEFGTASIQRDAEWHRGTFLDFMGSPWSAIFALGGTLVVFSVVTYFTSPDFSSYLQGLFVVFSLISFITLAAIILGAGWYFFSEAWVRLLPDNIDSEQIRFALEQSRPLFMSGRVPANSPPLTERTRGGGMLLRIPSVGKIGLLFESNDHSRLVVQIKRSVTNEDRQTVFNFIDNAIARAPEIPKEDDETED